MSIQKILDAISPKVIYKNLEKPMDEAFANYMRTLQSIHVKTEQELLVKLTKLYNKVYGSTTAQKFKSPFANQEVVNILNKAFKGGYVEAARQAINTGLLPVLNNFYTSLKNQITQSYIKSTLLEYIPQLNYKTRLQLAQGLMKQLGSFVPPWMKVEPIEVIAIKHLEDMINFYAEELKNFHRNFGAI